MFTISLQQGWLSDLGTYFNAIRSLIWSAGTIGMFILFKEMGDGRLTKSSKVVLMAVTVLTVLFQVLSGFLTGGVLQVSAVFLAMFLGTRRVPVTAVLSVVALFAFLHVGKADMRDEFWEAGKNYSTEWHNPVDILTFWTTASWKRLATESESDEEVRSLLDRGNLLGFLARVVADSPELIPFLGGTTYWQTVDIFIPRFISPDKPRSSTPNDTLAIQYGVLSINSADYTGVGLGRISEAWANFGWAGIIVIGAIMGLTLQIPTRLSGGYSPMHVRFLLAIPFVEFGMNLESCLGPTVHALFNGLLLSVVFLWVASLPTSAPVVDKTPLPEWLRDPR